MYARGSAKGVRKKERERKRALFSKPSLFLLRFSKNKTNSLILLDKKLMMHFLKTEISLELRFMFQILREKKILRILY